MAIDGVSFAPFEPALLSRLVAFWNAVFRLRRNFYPISEGLYRSRIVEQRAFDPAGLIVALADGDVIGLVHAIKPVSSDVSIYGRRRCRENGAIAVLAVAPSWRERGIGSTLLARAESYLAQHLASGRQSVLYAGDYDLPLYHTLEGPRQPFWGDTEMMGIAAGDAQVIAFLTRRGYRPVARDGQEVTMAAGLAGRCEPARPALEALGLQEARVSEERPWPGRIGWYPDGSATGYFYGAFGPYQHEAIALARGDTITAHVEWYRMRQAGWVALADIGVLEADRGRGLGQYLLDKALWAMAQEGAQAVELHTHTAKNAQACAMYLRRGFSIVETWVTLQKESGPELNDDPRRSDGWSSKPDHHT